MKIFSQKKETEKEKVRQNAPVSRAVHHELIPKRIGKMERKKTSLVHRDADIGGVKNKKQKEPSVDISFFTRKKQEPIFIVADKKEKTVERKIKEDWVRRFRTRFVLPLAMPVIIFGVISWSPWSSLFGTPPTKIYPTVCLGGWENPKNAEGTLSLPPGASPDQFNDRNSAVLRNSLAQIFCGGFKKEFLENAFPKKILLKFSWATVLSAVASEIPDSIKKVPEVQTFNVDLGGEDTASTTEIGATSTISIDSVSELMHSAPDISEEDDIISVSFFDKLFNVAFAETLVLVEKRGNITPTTHSDIASSTLSGEDDPAQNKPITVSTADLLQVLYSFDGQEWKQLGTVTRENLADLSFQVPISNKEELSHFQVSVQNVIALEDLPVVYLDGMWLEVEGK